jgi:hypothetical protein
VSKCSAGRPVHASILLPTRAGTPVRRGVDRAAGGEAPGDCRGEVVPKPLPTLPVHRPSGALQCSPHQIHNAASFLCCLASHLAKALLLRTALTRSACSHVHQGWTKACLDRGIRRIEGNQGSTVQMDTSTISIELCFNTSLQFWSP